MSSNIPQKVPQSGIPKSSGSSSVGTSGATSQRVQSTIPKQPESVKESEQPSKAAPQAIQTPPQINLAEMEAKYKQDLEALMESTEMATIEKELAEEKLDECERELQEVKEKLAEANSQIETLKNEQQANQSAVASSSDSSVTVFQLQKVEEHNELMKQALIRLRDISANDKRALETLQIEHVELQEKLIDLEEKEQKYVEQIKIFEEQIDVSQNAQEMVEKLTQQKTDLEDKLKEMVEDFDSMEKLRDITEQLLDSTRQNEIELTGELDTLRVKYSELNNKKRDMEDYLTDQERTVARLKEENRILEEHVSRLKDQFKEGESIEQQKHQIENVAYKLNFSESKMAEKEAEISRCRRNLNDMKEQMNSLSLITKEQAVQIDDLKLKYDAKASENTELQRALKKKMEEVSELEIRREMAEKKLQVIQRDTETKLSNMNRTIETMKGIEVQHEEDIKRLMEDNELIERERRDLRDQLNKSNRSLERSMQTGNLSSSMVTAQDTSLASLGISFQTNLSAQPSSSQYHQTTTSQQHNQSVNILQTQVAPLSSANGPARHIPAGQGADESFLLSRLQDISSAFDRVNRKNHELEMELAMRTLEIRIPSYEKSNVSTYYDMNRVKPLLTEVLRLKKEYRASILNQKICAKSRNIHSRTKSDRFDDSKFALKYHLLQNEANAVFSNSTLARFRPRVQLLQSTPVK